MCNQENNIRGRKKAIEITQNAKSIGLSVANMAKLTGLFEDEINNL